MTRTPMGRERVNFYFEKEIFEGLKALARLQNTTYSELIRIACREYVAAEGAKALAKNRTIKELNK